MFRPLFVPATYSKVTVHVSGGTLRSSGHVTSRSKCMVNRPGIVDVARLNSVTSRGATRTVQRLPNLFRYESLFFVPIQRS